MWWEISTRPRRSWWIITGARRAALELGSTEIVILGGTGSRVDHVLGNIQSMMLAKKKGVLCELLDEHNRIRLIDEETVIAREEQYGDYVSLIPLTTEVTGVTLTGFKYPLRDHTFTSTGSAGLGVSNEILAAEGRIQMKTGVFILIEWLFFCARIVLWTK